ncbi:MAG: hypothetical protein ACFCGT_20315, partial [Sandaracinaceae bacterium]
GLSVSHPRARAVAGTFGPAPAGELAPGGPGYLYPSTPGHRVRVATGEPAVLRATSTEGPVALAVMHGDEVDCDADGGHGHRPTVGLPKDGTYLVHVAALRGPGELAYALVAETVSAAAANPGGLPITVSSTPPGAAVRGPGGEVLGETPALVVVDRGANGEERSYQLELEGYRRATVEGEVTSGGLVLHADLVPEGQPAPGSRGASRPGSPPGQLPADAAEAVFRSLARALERCRDGYTNVARVELTVRGATGRVMATRVTGTLSGRARSCVAATVRRARFPTFTADRQEVEHTYRLRPRSARPSSGARSP